MPSIRRKIDAAPAVEPALSTAAWSSVRQVITPLRAPLQRGQTLTHQRARPAVDGRLRDAGSSGAQQRITRREARAGEASKDARCTRRSRPIPQIAVGRDLAVVPVTRT